ncbi:MAG: SAVED domain-containing protein [Pseudomonadota bacterium]
MSKTSIPEKVKVMLAGRAAGRCEFRGCNEELTEDQLTRSTANYGAFAHIVADSPGGPRGDEIRSPLLAQSIDNLMLMCFTHHKLIDGDHWRDYPEAELLEMKAEHEARIRDFTSHKGEHKTHLLLMDAGIGRRTGLVTREVAAKAVLPRYAQGETWIPLSRSRLEDGEDLFWQTGIVEVDRAAGEVGELFRRREVGHLSIFALGPIPLLMWLGYRLGDIFPGEAFQRRRDIQGWEWSESADDPAYELLRDRLAGSGGPAVLLISITDEVLIPEDLRNLPVLTLRAAAPRLDIIKTRPQVESFKHYLRQAMSLLKGFSVVHVVAALPNSLAVEFGMAQLPKVHCPLALWDKNEARGGFIPTIVLHGGSARLAEGPRPGA